jgi:myosin-crossreactive antigen
MSVGGTIVSAAEAREKQVVMAYQPHLLNHPTDVAGILGYSLFPDRAGNFFQDRWPSCNGAEALRSTCGSIWRRLGNAEFCCKAPTC